MAISFGLEGLPEINFREFLSYPINISNSAISLKILVTKSVLAKVVFGENPHKTSTNALFK